MKKLFTSQKGVIAISIVACLCLVFLLCIIITQYNKGLSNLATQQPWTSGQEEFNKAYEIVASDKETPTKTLNVPNLISNLGVTVDQCVANIGQGAKIYSSSNSGAGASAVTETIIVLTNESSDNKSVVPHVVATTDRSGRIIKLSFTGSTWALGYPRLSFVDMVDNNHLVEKTLNEAGLPVDTPCVSLPDNRSTYTQFASDGTTVVLESYAFSGKQSANGKNYSWTATPTYDYALANQSGNLSDTVRSITISVE